jgi:putative heme iron utilization protein
MSAAASAARQLLRAARTGALATLSAAHDGHPYASALPYLCDHAGRPLFLMSRLAEHARNLARDARASLLAWEPGDEVQALSRVTVLGAVVELSDQQAPRARWLRARPDDARLLALGDFSFHRLEPRRVRHIAGFGAIHWHEAGSFLAAAGALEAAEDGIVAHMNDDHAETLRLYCRHVHGIDPCDATLAGVDCDGFDARAGGRLLRFAFPEPAPDAAAVRRQFIALAAAARAAGG